MDPVLVVRTAVLVLIAYLAGSIPVGVRPTPHGCSSRRSSQVLPVRGEPIIQTSRRSTESRSLP